MRTGIDTLSKSDEAPRSYGTCELAATSSERNEFV